MPKSNDGSGKDMKCAKIEGEKVSSSLRERYILLWGISIGLIFGMLGDLLASHWIEVLRVLVLDGWWLTINVIATLGILLCILFLAFWLFQRMREIQSHHRLVETLIEILKENEK